MMRKDTVDSSDPVVLEPASEEIFERGFLQCQKYLVERTCPNSSYDSWPYSSSPSQEDHYDYFARCRPMYGLLGGPKLELKELLASWWIKEEPMR
jgi:hypothetical protein